MSFLTTSALLDSVVLASLSGDDGYGYVITQNVTGLLGVSDSTIYPALRRLQKEDLLETYDRQENGRNRRYYRITDRGKKKLASYLKEWENVKEGLDELFSVSAFNATTQKCKKTEGGAKS